LVRVSSAAVATDAVVLMPSVWGRRQLLLLLLLLEIVLLLSLLVVLVMLAQEVVLRSPMVRFLLRCRSCIH
jgi:hypothetical protein